MEPTDPHERDGYLLRGRRVLIADLMNAGLLDAGTQLVFRRPRLGTNYTATVTPDGKLRLADGRTYNAPSRAATAAAGGSLDGWHAWQVSPDGEFLDALRQRLLDQVASKERVRDVEDGRVSESNYEFLRNARQLAEARTPLELRVRDLLARWNATGRSQVASEQLAADLENHGLTTNPPFLKTGLDSLVTLVETPSEPQVEIDDASDEPAPEPVSPDEVGLTLGNIPSANLGVEAVTPQATYEEAITLMLLNDYSQLAVMTGPRSNPRAVTWQSIARERHANPDGTLSNAIVAATTLTFDTELVDVLPILEEQDFVFVKDDTNVVTGIVTTADVVRAYGQMATPFFLIGELDHLLRRLVADNFGLEDVRGLCDGDGGRNLQTFEELTMGDYQRMLENEANWKSLGWPLDRSTFAHRLSQLREVRNDLMHFNPDPIPESTVGQLRHMIRLLKRYSST